MERAQILAANEATFAAWNAHDPDAVAAIFAEDAEIVDVMTGDVVHGRDAIRAQAAERFTGFSDFRLERRMLLIDGETNSDRWVMTGTHDGEFLGLAPTGRRVEVHGATFSEFGEDGLVARDTHYVDVRALLRQLTG